MWIKEDLYDKDYVRTHTIGFDKWKAYLLGEEDGIAKTPEWQEKETGDIYLPPYFVGDRLISVRKLPFNVSTRFHATGKLIGRLTLVLIAAVVIDTIGSEYLHLRNEAYRDSSLQLDRTAERLVLGHRVLSATEPDRRPAIARALSAEDLDLAWSAERSTIADGGQAAISLLRPVQGGSSAGVWGVPRHPTRSCARMPHPVGPPQRVLRLDFLLCRA